MLHKHFNSTQFILIIFVLFVIFTMGFGNPTPWTGLSVFACLGIFFFSGSVVIKTKLDVFLSTSANFFDNTACLVITIVLNIAMGITLALSFWTASLYVFKNSWFGSLLLLCFMIIGVWQFIKKYRTSYQLYPSQTLIWISIIAIIIGIYHNYFLEFQYNGFVYYNGFYRTDLVFHTFIASLIYESGLPLINIIGNPEYAFQPPGHYGVMILIAGVRHITGLTIYQSVKVLSIIGYLMVALTSLSFVIKSNIKFFFLFIISIGSLIWGSLSIPIDFFSGNIAGVFNPYIFSYIKPNCPSGSMYHNITQLFAIIITGAGVLSLRIYLLKKQNFFFLLSCFFIAITFNIKPSITILTIPAFFIFLFLSKTFSISKYINALLIFSLSIAVYYLPLLYCNQFQISSWEIKLPEKPLLEIFLTYSTLIGLGWIILIMFFLKLFRKQKTKLEIVDFLGISLIGGILFSLFFIEQGARDFHGNQFWGLTSILVLISPFVIYKILMWMGTNNEKPLKKIMNFFIGVLLGFQLLSGIFYGFRFPIGSIAKHKIQMLQSLNEMKSCTP